MDLKYFKNTGLMNITEEDIEDPGTRMAINNIFAKQQKQWNDETVEIQTLYGISDLWASYIWYLRQRSRWTQELEDKVLKMAENNEELPWGNELEN
jgi:hypothetical protein